MVTEIKIKKFICDMMVHFIWMREERQEEGKREKKEMGRGKERKRKGEERKRGEKEKEKEGEI